MIKHGYSCVRLSPGLLSLLLFRSVCIWKKMGKSKSNWCLQNGQLRLYYKFRSRVERRHKNYRLRTFSFPKIWYLELMRPNHWPDTVKMKAKLLLSTFTVPGQWFGLKISKEANMTCDFSCNPPANSTTLSTTPLLSIFILSNSSADSNRIPYFVTKFLCVLQIYKAPLENTSD